MYDEVKESLLEDTLIKSFILSPSEAPERLFSPLRHQKKQDPLKTATEGLLLYDEVQESLLKDPDINFFIPSPSEAPR